MKVAFVARDTMYSGRGGDTIQILKTAYYLRKLGVEVDVFRTSERIDYSKYDILHGFNAIRPPDLLPHFRKFDGIKVLTPIYVNYYEFEVNAREGLVGRVFRAIGNDRTEYLKTVMRWIKNGENNFDLEYLLKGHRSGLKKVVELSDILLPNSHSEYRRLSQDYQATKKYAVIPNAIDPELFREDEPQAAKDPALVICMAKIDGRKNQLNLIRALNKTQFRLVLIGKTAPNHMEYYRQCRAEAGDNISFIEEMEQEELLTYYRQATVHAMPSWFESTGLSTLEAAAMRCNVVISDKGDTEEYFGTFGVYANPADPADIYRAVCEASEKPFDESFRKKIYSEYIWQNTAEKTLQAYKSCL